MTELEPCRGPLCPLMALYGSEKGRELFQWLEELAADNPVPALELKEMNESDYFLVLPVGSFTDFKDKTIPERDISFSGLQLELNNPAHPLKLDWAEAARLGNRSALMVNFDLHNFTPDEYRQMVGDLLAAARSGVKWLRLDAGRAPLWPDGNKFMCRLEAHGFVQLVRRTLDVLAAHIRLVVGENIPQIQNFSFFGGGGEATMIENMAFGPLILHTLESGQVRELESWAGELRLPFPGLTFYNTLRLDGKDSFRCVENILPPGEIEKYMERRTREPGFTSALMSMPGGEQFHRLQERLRVAQAILLSLTGVPGFERATLPGGRLLQTRASCPAFHPFGAQLVLPGENPAVFSLMRIAPDGRSVAICLQNVTLEPQQTRLDLAALGMQGNTWRDRITGALVDVTAQTRLNLQGGQSLWLVPE